MDRYHAVHDHWATNFPPPYVSMGLMAGIKPASRPLTADFDPHAVSDPAVMESYILAMPGGVKVNPEGFLYGPPLPVKTGGTDG